MFFNFLSTHRIEGQYRKELADWDWKGFRGDLGFGLKCRVSGLDSSGEVLGLSIRREIACFSRMGKGT